MFGKPELARFWNDGYVIGDIGLDGNCCKRALAEVASLTFYPIFRKVYSNKLDEFRRQADVPELGDMLKEIESRIEGMVVGCVPQWKIAKGSWHALKSLPGGRDQDVHKDFPTFETARAHKTQGMVPASVIVALMDDTTIHMYPGCFGSSVEKSRRRTLSLSQGEIIIFRGDLAHAEAKHNSLNIRLHCYIQVKGVRQKGNSTEAVVFNTYMCNKCNELLYARRELSRHRRECSENCPFKCPLCPKSYDIANSLHQHIRRKHANEREALRQTRVQIVAEDEEDADVDSEENNDEESEEDSQEDSNEDSDEDSDEDMED